jgi:hypothetical protein
MSGKIARLDDFADDADAKPIVVGQDLTKPTMAPWILDYSKMSKVRGSVEVPSLPRVDTDIDEFHPSALARPKATSRNRTQTNLCRGAFAFWKRQCDRTTLIASSPSRISASRESGDRRLMLLDA